jgi:hypothetical protein
LAGANGDTGLPVQANTVAVGERQRLARQNVKQMSLVWSVWQQNGSASDRKPHRAGSLDEARVFEPGPQQKVP